MQRCSRCVNLSTRPRIEFVGGVCSACRYAEKRAKIFPEEWKKRSNEFMRICDKYRRYDGSYDCIVPCSGGKDSSRVAYEMKYKYRMNPLAVTFAPVIATGEGQRNIEALRVAGIDNVVFHPNEKVMSRLCREMFLRFGDPFLPWVIGIYSFPLRLAKEMSIKLVVYAECGEVAYGGDSKMSDKALDVGLMQKLASTGSEGFKSPKDWVKFGFSKEDIYPFIVPDDISGIDAVFFAYYHPWSVKFNKKFAEKYCGFKGMEGRMLGTYQGYSSIDDKIDGLYMYLMYCKFGFARCTKDCCKEIREGTLSRDEALSLIGRYDGEFPYTKKGFKELLAYLNIIPFDFWAVVTNFINPIVWKRTNVNRWVNSEGAVLKLPLWM